MFNLIGKTFGQYRILEKIGLGGMATVYKAYQPSMDRHVAIKVLPPQLSDDEQFVKRFQREAHAIAKLEHAHILPVFDYGESEGVTYIAMRYIPAGTLKEYLTQGRPPLDEVARIIGQIGSALDYAHQQGIIHRDIKPSNVLMGEQGNTYLTDFGLARMLESSQQLTGSGVGVGTPAYMAPEQGLGNKADHRSDIYSLGVILYEMVTGHVPYEAETPMAVVLKHINEPLPLPRTILPEVPELVEMVILKALAKEPAHRYQSAADLVEALNTAVRKASLVEEKRVPAPKPAPAVEAVPESVETPSAKPRQTFWQRSWVKPALMIGTLVILGVLVLSLMPGRTGIPANAPLDVSKPTNTMMAVSTPPPTATAMGGAPGAVSSPPGPCLVAYSEKTGDNVSDIFVRNCDGSNVHQITHGRISTGHEPSWSPDGRQLVFDDSQGGTPVSQGWIPPAIFLVNADGSGLTRLTPLNSGDNFPAWSPDGSRIAFQRSADLYLINPDGTDLTLVLDHQRLSGADGGEMFADQPVWSPDGKRIAFVAFPPASFNAPPAQVECRFYAVNVDGSGLVKLFVFQSKVHKAGSGWAAWSPDGKQVAFEVRVEEDGPTKYYIVNADGSGEPKEIDFIPESWYPWYRPQWGFQKSPITPTPSPVSECLVAYSKHNSGEINDLYVRNCNGSNVRQITHERLSTGHEPSWSPDGQQLVFDDSKVDTKIPKSVASSLYIVNIDGSGLIRLTIGTSDGWFPSWSPDGNLIVFHGGGAEISTIHPDGTKLTHILHSEKLIGPGGVQMYGDQLVWSPDSKRIAFIASPEGSQKKPEPGLLEYRFYAINVDGTGLVQLYAFKSKVFKGGHGWPAWSPDGKQVAFEVKVDEQSERKHYLVNSDGSGGLKEIDPIPESWYPWHWPQWDRVQAVRTFTAPKDFQAAIAALGAPKVINFEKIDAKPVDNTFKDRKPFDGATYANEGIVFSSPYRTPLYIAPGGLFWNASNSLSIGQFPNDINAKVEDTNDDVTIKLDPPVIAIGFTLIDLAKREASSVTWLDVAGAVVAKIPLPKDYVDYRAFVGILSPGRPIAKILVDDGLPKDEDDVNYDDFIFIPAFPASKSSMADQARAFAEPILEAIADRKPDFADDFSTAGKGWDVGNQDEGEWFVIEDGVARLGVNNFDLVIGNQAINRKDFVLQLDARVVDGKNVAQNVNFHGLSSEYWFYVTFTSEHDYWGVDKRLNGVQTSFANGQGIVSPVGEVTQVLIVAKGSQAAVYLNGTPVAYFDDPDFNISGGTGLFCQSDGEAVCEFDNLKFWNLANVPGLP